MPITLEQAKGMIDKACVRASEFGVNVGVAVVDDGGHVIASGRMDGTGFLALEMAVGKAFTAAAFRNDTAQMSKIVGQMPFFANGPEMPGGRLVLMGGGVPVREGSQVIGAIGVAGASEEQDVDCALVAIG